MQFSFISDGRSQDLEFAVRNGIKAIELNGFLLDDLDDFHHLMPTFDHVISRVPEVASCVSKGELKIAAAAVWTNVMHPDERQRARAREAVRQMLGVCSQLRSSILLTFAGDNQQWSYERKLDEFDRFFGPLIESSRRIGVNLSVARCNWNNFAGSLSAWTELHRRHPNLGFKWDPTHAYTEGTDYEFELATCAPWINHFHAKDIQILGSQIYEYPPPGMGDINWGKLMSILHHVKYKGAVSYELHSKLWVSDQRYEGILLAQRHLSQFIVPGASDL